MAASIGQAISDFIAGTDDLVAKTVASEINKKHTKFLEFIECLGPPLSGSNTDNVARGRATRLIGDVISLLPTSFLSTEQVEVVATFLLAKLADHHSVQPAALHSVAVLTNRCSPLPEGLPSQICLTIFREIQNQSLSHTDRRNNYLIFQNLLASSGKELERMGGDFVIGFIQQMDAEKDPRNLLLVFNCSSFIISNIPLGAFTEEMFEVLGCYFPIEFTPPPSNPHGITKEELIVSLRKCFSATPDFAPFCLPLLLEKITSDLQSARVDALETLIDCAPVYRRKGMTEYFGSITSSLKREVLMDLCPELVHTSREALTAVFKAMCPPEGVQTTQDESLTTSMVEVYQDVFKFLDGSNPKKTCLAFSVCRAIAASSATAFHTVIPLALPALIKACTDSLQDTDKILYLQEINAALRVMKTLEMNKEQKEKIGLWEPLCGLFEGIINSGDCDNICKESVIGITLLMTVGDIISAQKSQTFIKSMIRIGASTEDKALRKEILSSMAQCLVANSSLVEETVNYLKDDIGNNSPWTFECLAYACVDSESFLKVIPIFLDSVSQPVLADSGWRGIDAVCSLITLTANQHPGSATVDLMVQSLTLPLLRICVSLCPQWSEMTRDKCEQFMSVCRDVFRIISNKIKSSDAKLLWEKLSLFMRDGNVACIDYAGDTELKPLQASSPWQQSTLVAFLEGFLAGVKMQSINESLEEVFGAVFSLARDSTDEFTHLSACRCSAIIMNKAGLGSQIHWLLEPITQEFQKTLASVSDVDKTPTVRFLHVWIWLTKALECRGHSAAGIFTSKLINLLADTELGSEAACGLGTLFENLPCSLSVSLNANVSPMYKQRVFNLNLKSLLEGYEKVKDSKEISQNYLLAFSLITSHLPQQVLKPKLDQLVSLLLKSLDRLSGQFQESTLSTLTNAVLHTPDAMVSSVDSLIPRLLSIARVDPKMTVRTAALKCLERVAELPIHSITPHQQRVVKELAGTLDDRKRLVRMQAVQTRNAWILAQESKK